MTASEIPKPDLERFYSVPAEAVILSYLSRPMALQSLQKNLRPLMSAELVKDAISELIAKGEIADEKTLRVTPAGRQTALKILGRDADEKWENIKSKRLPLVALGLNPDDSDVRSKFSGADTLKTATIAVAFGLPKQMVGARKAVLSEIVWQLLKSTAPSVVGKGPFPIIEKLGVVERAILGGLAGIRPKSIPQAIDALAARAIGLEKTGADALRIRLIAIGVARCRKAKASDSRHKSTSIENLNDGNEFAANVGNVASQLVTPPFQDRVAIAQVYDAYGRLYPDAGSLESFKKRLVGAARAHRIRLGRLDLPERMGKELRERSETHWDKEEVHFIITQ